MPALTQFYGLLMRSVCEWAKPASFATSSGMAREVAEQVRLRVVLKGRGL
jgi:hypothetical protein